MYPPILLVCITAEQQALEVKAPRSQQSTDKPSVKSIGYKCSKNESWSVPDICKFLNVYLTNTLTTYRATLLQKSESKKTPFSRSPATRACSNAGGWGTALQTRRSWLQLLMVSLEFFTDIILGLTQPLTEMNIRNISWGWRLLVCRTDNLTTFVCQMSWNLAASISWNPQGLPRLVQGLLYLYQPLPLLNIDLNYADKNSSHHSHIFIL
jgi:hypothetical protein